MFLLFAETMGWPNVVAMFGVLLLFAFLAWVLFGRK